MCTYGDDSDYLHYFAMSGSAYETNLDHAQSYGVSNVGEDETSVPRAHDGRSKMATGFDPTDVPSEERTYVYRDGRWWEKWQWLNQVSDGYPHFDQERVQSANIERDFEIIGDELGVSQECEEKSIDLLNEVRDNRDYGLRFGGTFPIEVMELASVSLIARSMLDVDDMSAIDSEDHPLHDAAMNGPTFKKLMRTLPPKGTDVSKQKMRKARQRIRDNIEISEVI